MPTYYIEVVTEKQTARGLTMEHPACQGDSFESRGILFARDEGHAANSFRAFSRADHGTGRTS